MVQSPRVLPINFEEVLDEIPEVVPPLALDPLSLIFAYFVVLRLLVFDELLEGPTNC